MVSFCDNFDITRRIGNRRYICIGGKVGPVCSKTFVKKKIEDEFCEWEQYVE